MSFVTYLLLDVKIKKAVFNFNLSRANASCGYIFSFSKGSPK